MPLWLRPGANVFWKNTRSPGLRSSREGCEPLLYWPNSPRLTCWFNWRATYQTKPEQSKPRGVDPPHTYGEPRNLSAAPASPSLGAPGGTATTAIGATGFGEGEVVGV